MEIVSIGGEIHTFECETPSGQWLRCEVWTMGSNVREVTLTHRPGEMEAAQTLAELLTASPRNRGVTVCEGKP